MGQKVNPYGIRVGIVNDWESKWYDNDANKNLDFAKKFTNDRRAQGRVDYSATRQFIRRIMQKITKRLVLPRDRLLA